MASVIDVVSKHHHPLTKFINEHKKYHCHGCKIPGYATGYRCDPCDFDLHDYCATGPTTLSTFMHPGHDLTLVTREPQDTRLNNRACDICGHKLEGLFYMCTPCGFDVHPVCSQLPQFLPHALHPEHKLTLLIAPSSSSPPPSSCLVCKKLCGSWHYGCAVCRVGVHLECRMEPAPAGSVEKSPAPYASHSPAYPPLPPTPAIPHASHSPAYPPLPPTPAIPYANYHSPAPYPLPPAPAPYGYHSPAPYPPPPTPAPYGCHPSAYLAPPPPPPYAYHSPAYPSPPPPPYGYYGVPGPYNMNPYGSHSFHHQCSHNPQSVAGGSKPQNNGGLMGRIALGLGIGLAGNGISDGIELLDYCSDDIDFDR